MGDFLRRRGRPATEQDEWFVPYRPPNAPLSSYEITGVGRSPSPARQSRSIFGALGNSLRRPRTPGALPRSASLASLPQDASSSMGRLASSNSVPTGLVAPKMLFSPLGREIRESYLAEAEAGPSAWQERDRARQEGDRSRRPSDAASPGPQRWVANTPCDTYVLPRPRIKPHTITPPESPTEQARRAQPGAGADFDPETARVLDEGRARAAERDDWEAVVRRRGRSLSFGRREPPPNAPVIGSARARSHERSRSRDRTGDGGKSSGRGRSRAGSLGSLFRSSRSVNDDGEQRPAYARQHSQPTGSFGFLSRRTRLPSSASQPSLFIHRREESFDASRPTQRYHDAYGVPDRRGGGAFPPRAHQHTRSDPDLLGRFAPVHQVGTPRQLQFTQEGRGVVVINATPKKQQPDPDFNKPLPAVPSLPRASSAAPSSAILPSISHDTSHPIPSTSYLPMPDAPPLTASSSHSRRSPSNDPSPAHARDMLAKQHQRALTKRAFQTPMGSMRSASSGSSARPPLSAGAAQTTFPHSSLFNTPTPADSRNRAASLGSHAGPSHESDSLNAAIPGLAVIFPSGQQAGPGSTPSSPTRPGPPYQGPPLSPIEARMRGLTRVDYPSASSSRTARPESPGMGISRQIPLGAGPRTPAEAAQQTPTSQLLVPGRPALSHAASSTSGVSVYTDATEGYGRSEGLTTPVPQATPAAEHGPLSPIGSEGSIATPRHSSDDRDFMGLFFRTPADPMTPQSPAFQQRQPPPRANFPRLGGDTVGLGYGLDQSKPSTASGQSSSAFALPPSLYHPSPRRAPVQPVASLQDAQQASRDRVPRHPSESQSEATFELSTPVIVETARVPHTDAEDRFIAQQMLALADGKMSRETRRDSEETGESYAVDLGSLSLIKAPSHVADVPDGVVVRLSRVASGKVTQAMTATSTRQEIAVRKHRSFSADVAEPMSPATFGVAVEQSPTSPVTTLRSAHTPSEPPSPTANRHVVLAPPVPPVPPVPSVTFTPSLRQGYSLSPHTHSPSHSPARSTAHPTSPTSGHSPIIDGFRRSSAAVSFIDNFPSPPLLASPKMATALELDMPEGSMPVKHASAFGQLVTGPPGAGKSTYCHGMHQFLTALGRPVAVVNLDPAVEAPPYPCALSITDLISIDDIMEQHGLGPNGAILYAVEYLEANIDWLIDGLDSVLAGMGGNGYVIFDTPGQVELWTNHDSLKRVIGRLTKMEYRLVAVHLSDAHYITDASKYISVVLLALRAMLQLELPHVNVLSKMDLMAAYGSDLPFNLDYYTEVQDLGYLLQTLEKDPRAKRLGKLNRAMCDLIEDFSLVGFETLAVEDKSSMANLLRALDKVNGYVFVPPAGNDPAAGNLHALFSSAVGVGDVRDVQERWIDRKDAWDDWEKDGWRDEWARHGAERGAGAGEGVAKGGAGEEGEGGAADQAGL